MTSCIDWLTGLHSQ